MTEPMTAAGRGLLTTRNAHARTCQRVMAAFSLPCDCGLDRTIRAIEDEALAWGVMETQRLLGVVADAQRWTPSLGVMVRAADGRWLNRREVRAAVMRAALARGRKP